MRDYGRVHTSFWTSETTRSLSEDARNLALYLLTCPHNTIAGVFRLPDGYVCDDLQWTSERVSKGFSELLANGFANRCETTKWVWIYKHLKWNPPENPNQKKSAEKLAKLVPEKCSWLPNFIGECGDFFGMENKPFRNPSATLSKPEAVTVTVTVTEAETVKSSAIHSERDLAPPEEKNRAASQIPAEAEFAIELRSLGVNVQSHNPTLLAWIADGITIKKLTEAAAIARLKKPLPELIPANFLDRIVREPPRQQSPPTQYQTAAGRRAAEFDRAAAEFLGGEKLTGTDLKVIEGGTL